MVTKIEDNEMRASTFVLVHERVPAEGTGQFEIAGAGKHPKCKLLKGWATAQIYNSAADVIAIEHEDGGDVASATASATVHTPVALTIAPAAGYSAIFERDEPIIVKASTQGNAANSTRIVCVFETMEN